MKCEIPHPRRLLNPTISTSKQANETRNPTPSTSTRNPTPSTSTRNPTPSTSNQTHQQEDGMSGGDTPRSDVSDGVRRGRAGHDISATRGGRMVNSQWQDC